MTRLMRTGWVLLAFAAAACSPGSTPTGTAAATPPASMQLAASPAVVACPANPGLDVLIALDENPGPLTASFRPDYGHYSEAAEACYRDAELAFVAFAASPEGLGGLREYVIEPAWLVARGHWVAADDAVESEGFFSGPFLPVAVPPEHAAAFETLRGGWVEVVGHFSDRAAETCRVAEGGPHGAPIAEQAIAICRTAFVVTDVRRVAAPNP